MFLIFTEDAYINRSYTLKRGQEQSVHHALQIIIQARSVTFIMLLSPGMFLPRSPLRAIRNTRQKVAHAHLHGSYSRLECKAMSEYLFSQQKD